MIPAAATRTPPTKPGWYWFWTRWGSNRPHVLEVREFSKRGVPIFKCRDGVWGRWRPVTHRGYAQPRGWWLEIAPPE